LAMLEIAAKNGFKPWEYRAEIEQAVTNLDSPPTELNVTH